MEINFKSQEFREVPYHFRNEKLDRRASMGEGVAFNFKHFNYEAMRSCLSKKIQDGWKYFEWEFMAVS